MTDDSAPGPLAPDDIYAETLAALEELRDAVQSGVADRRADSGKPPGDVLAVVAETSRLTTMMTSMMALLLLHRAAAAGEIDRAMLLADGAGIADGVRRCRSAAPAAAGRAGLPQMLSALADRGDRLADRVLAVYRAAGSAGPEGAA